MHYGRSFIVFLAWASIAGSEPRKTSVPPEVQSALDEIRASSLRKDLSFIASDELEGRDSPSPGLDRAADYIADQFRHAGLEPGVEDSYFQRASMLAEEPNFDNFEFVLSNGGRQFVAAPKVTQLRVATALNFAQEPVFKLDLADAALMEHLSKDEVANKVVIMEVTRRVFARYRQAAQFLRDAKPALLIVIDPRKVNSRDRPRRRLVDTDEKAAVASAPRVLVYGDAAAAFFSGLKSGEGSAMADIHIAAPHRTPATMRNVIGVLRGSDPSLRDTCVLLTAHYDHLGVKSGPGDRIYNGANDDGSGTVSVMEVARALGRLPRHPRRSIVFMTFFGEEEGLVGSQYYVHHPVWPLDKTVADLNLEQVGRTDATEGRQLSNATMTGFDFSDLTGYIQQAGESTGIRIYKNPKNSDAYFTDSDNYSFAEAGVPDETLTVAFDFPDYHGLGDKWQKIDYENMAKVDRAVALAIFLAADTEQPIRWNEANPKTAPFVKAAKQRNLE